MNEIQEQNAVPLPTYYPKYENSRTELEFLAITFPNSSNFKQNSITEAHQKNTRVMHEKKT